MKKNTYQLIRKSLEKLSRSRNHESKSATNGDESLQLIALEDRVLYDAAPFDMEAMAVDVQVDEACVQDGEVVDWAEVVSGSSEQTDLDGMQAGIQALEMLDTATDELNAELTMDSGNVDLPELVVIDSAVENYEQLLADLTSSGNIEILVVGADQNGFQLVADRLQQPGGAVSAIHIISHGSDGVLNLGNATLSLDSLDQHSDTLASWQAGLSEDADLLFYGCDLATNGDGQMLLSHIVDLTDADVAASTDLTGHESLGGDWVLEFESGVVQTEVIVTHAAQEFWTSVLLSPTDVVAMDTPIAADVTDVSLQRENRGSGNSVGIDDEGNYVIVWSQFTQATGWDVVGQRYDFLGGTVGNQFTINETIAGNQQWASVDVDATGNFVVTWSDRDNEQVLGRYFAADGFDTGEFVVANNAEDSAVTINDQGRYAFAWENANGGGVIGASYYDSDHSLINAALDVVVVPGSEADISLNNLGELAVVFESDFGSVIAQRFDDQGLAPGGIIDLLPTYNDPTVRLADNGYLFVAAENNDPGPNGGGGVDLIVFNDTSTFFDVLSINDTQINNQLSPSLSLLSGNEIGVVWSGFGDQTDNADNEGVFYKQYSIDYSTNVVSVDVAETRVNDFTIGNQANASIAGIGSDNFVIVWDGPAAGVTDTISHSLIRANQAPESLNPQAFPTQGIDYTFTLADFDYSDIEGDAPDRIEVGSLPANGMLLLNDMVVSNGREIDIADIVNGDLVYRQQVDGFGDDFDSFEFRIHDGNSYSQPSELEINVFPTNTLWISTDQTVTGVTGIPGPTDWHQGDTFQFGGTNLQLGELTAGSFSQQFSLADFVEGNIDGLHFVNQEITIGQNSQFTLNAGDVVFSTTEDVMLPGVPGLVESNDIIVFRPTVDDYSNGVFSVLFDYSSQDLSAPNFMQFEDLQSLTIVEQRTTVGDVVLEVGQILFSVDGIEQDSIFQLDLIDIGLGNSDVETSLLVDGSQLGIQPAIAGLELIERDTVVGGLQLTGGALLVTLDSSDLITDADLITEDVDISQIVLETTSVNGAATGTASLVFDGSDVGLPQGSAFDLDALSVVTRQIDLNDAPEVLDQFFNIDENSPNDSVVGTVQADDPDSGDVLKYRVSGGSGVGVFDIDPDTGEIFVIDASALDFEDVESYTLHVTVTDTDGLVDTASMTIEINDKPENTISGNVLHDVDGDGSITSAVGNADGFNQAIVHLYQDTNNNNTLDDGDQLVATELTSSDGLYEFEDVDNGTFFVVVDSRSLGADSYTDVNLGVGDVFAEQTYGSAGSLYNDGTGEVITTSDGVLFGGRTGTGSDDLSSLATAEHVTLVELSDADQDDVDFGFSFNVVTNLEGGDIAAVTGQTAQGSLRQFIINANAIVGGNELRFVPAVSVNELTRETWQIEIIDELPVITDDETVINGQAFDFRDGFSEVDFNNQQVGTTTTVGVNDFQLEAFDRPELELINIDGAEYGISVNANNVIVDGLRVEGFGVQRDTANIIVHNSDDFVLRNSHLVDAGRSNLIVRADSDRAIIENNFIETADKFGIELDGELGAVLDAQVRENFIINNATDSLIGDGIDAKQGTTAVIEHNLFTGNQGSAVDSFQNPGGLSIRDNTIDGNGTGGVETSGIRLFGDQNQVVENVITNNSGAGVFLVAEGTRNTGGTDFNEISQNEFGGNGGIAIDLGESAETLSEVQVGDGVSDFSTPNPLAANQGIQTPTLLASTFDPDTGATSIEGVAGPNERIEIYRAVADANGADNDQGEGVEYLGWVLSNASGEFQFQTNSLGPNDSISAIAIDANSNTSEFSMNLEVNVIPDASSFGIDLSVEDVHQFAIADFQFTDFENDNFQGVTFVSVPTEGMLLLDGMAVVAGQQVSAFDIDNGLLTYVPPNVTTASPLDSFEFNVSDGIDNSNNHSITISLMNDAPVISTDPTVTIDENEDLIQIQASDPNGQTLLYSLGSGNDEGLFEIDEDSGLLKFLVPPDFESPDANAADNVYEVLVRVDDGANTTEQLISIQVQDINDEVPVFTSANTFPVVENESVSLFIVAEDADSTDVFRDITYSIDTNFGDGAQFVIDPATGVLTMASIPDFENPMDLDGDNTYDVRVLASDGLNEGVQEIEIVVLSVNDNIHTIDTETEQSIDEGETFVVDVEFTDADGPTEPHTFALQNFGDRDLFDIDVTTGELTFLVAPDFENRMDEDLDGVYVVVVEVTDSDDVTVARRLDITVLDVDEPITGIVVPDSVDENAAAGTVLGNIVAQDPEQAGGIEYILTDDAGGIFDIDPDTGALLVVDGSALNFEAQNTHQITVQAVDSTGIPFEETVTINVNDVNEAPIAVDLVYGSAGAGALLEGGNLMIDLADFSGITDPDGDNTTLQIINSGSHGTAVRALGGLSYTHSGGEEFTDVLTYRVTDGNGGFDTGTITIHIDPVNDAPTAVGEQFVQNVAGSVNISRAEILQNDFDPDSANLSIVVVDGPNSGTFTVNPDGSWTFLPDTNTPTIETVRYFVTDGMDNSRIVTAELLIPFPAPEPEVELEQESPSEFTPEFVDTSPGDNDDDEEDSDNLDRFDGATFADFIGDSKANDIESEEFLFNSNLSGSSLLTTNYGFAYQKSSVDLSQLIVESDSKSVAKFSEGLDSFDSTQYLSSIWEGLDRVNEDILENISSATGSIVTAAGITGLATAVYVLWMARGGMLVASVVTSMPAWQSFDPLPILQYSADNIDSDADDDSIESLLDRE